MTNGAGRGRLQAIREGPNGGQPGRRVRITEVTQRWPIPRHARDREESEDMKKTVVLLSAAGVVALLVAGLAGSFGGGATPAVYASRLAGISGAGITGIQIQNLDASASATIQADFYKQGGGVAPVQIQRPDVGPGSAANIYLPQEKDLANGAYAAIISADRQIAAIARTDWSSSGGAAIYSNVQPGTDVTLALAAKKYNGQTSLVSVQNTDTGQQANAKLQFFKAGEATAMASKDVSIQPGTSVTVDLSKDGSFASVPEGTFGSMKVTSNVAVGVQTFIDFENMAKAVYAFEGVPSEQAAAKLYAPLIRNAFAGATTGISVVNPGANPVQVTLTYYGSPLSQDAQCKSGASFVHNGGPVTLPGGAGAVFYQGDVSIPVTGKSTLPTGCLGAAVIEATGGSLLAIVNDATNATSAAYNAASEAQGAKTVALPLYRNNHTPAQLSTGIQVMNIGDQTANVTIELKNNTGTILSNNCAECTQQISKLGSYTWYPPSMPSQAGNQGVYGSAKLTSNNNQPIVAIVNDASKTGAFDAAIYNGIKADN